MKKLVLVILLFPLLANAQLGILPFTAKNKIASVAIGSEQNMFPSANQLLLHNPNTVTSVGLFATASTTFNKTIAYSTNNPKKGKEKIVVGWIINTVGAFFVYQSFAIRRRGIYNYYAGGQTDMRQKSIAAASLGGLCLVIGTANLVKGYKLKKEANVAALVSPNNISLVYRW